MGRSVIAELPPRDYGDHWECQCARCGSSCDYEHCEHCDDGFDGHECGEDVCCCLDPEPNVRCEICEGHGGWWMCLSSPEWCERNPLTGRNDVERGKIEWFEVDPD